ncbi:uncharacterized protein LOC101862177 [Aplysia californica]|uniref:Uncharacterized protein LOC101862177 n=1 Tax=Aplysia californica TaxID=6500 RepID=A0ABM0JLQ4_APLCA|nr:uncharacterized protein LOC101862177 [Aplysia californica]
MKVPVISAVSLLLAVLPAFCVEAATIPITIKEKWYYRKDIDVVCLKCHGNTYLVARCEGSSEPRSHCEKCPAHQYQEEEWHLNRDCLDSSTRVFSDTPCPENMYNDGGECRPCPEKCPEGQVRRRGSACRSDGAIMCCLGSYNKTNGNAKCSWLEAEKVEELTPNHKKVADTEPEQLERKPGGEISKELGQDAVVGPNPVHRQDADLASKIFVPVIFIIAVIFLFLFAGRKKFFRFNSLKVFRTFNVWPQTKDTS